VGGSRAGCAAARFKLQPSMIVGGCSKGRLTTRYCKTGVAQDVERRRLVDGAPEASYEVWQ
jgi:hypothetical protein